MSTLNLYMHVAVSIACIMEQCSTTYLTDYGGSARSSEVPAIFSAALGLHLGGPVGGDVDPLP